VIRKNILLFALVLALYPFINGCTLFEYALSDVSGWDLSACVNGFDTCVELFLDNSDKVGGDFITAFEGQNE
jgi:hypothetical protein